MDHAVFTGRMPLYQILEIVIFVCYRVFEAFGKVLSVQLAPDHLRPGKHRYVNVFAVRLNNLCRFVLNIVTAQIPAVVLS